MKYFIKYHAIMIALSITAVLAVALPAAAEDYQFQQVISGYEDCTHTTLQTAEGQTNNVNCAVFSPTVDEFSANNGRPIVRGVFDSVHSTGLSVTFNEKVYALGTDAELIQNGNLWVLDLSGLSLAIAPGTYNVLVEMMNQFGQFLSASRSVEVGVSQPQSISTPFGPLAPTGQSSYTSVVGGLALISVSIAMLMLLKHVKKRRKYDY